MRNLTEKEMHAVLKKMAEYTGASLKTSPSVAILPKLTATSSASLSSVSTSYAIQ